MYLEHFNFSELPFTLTPNVNFFCQLKGHQEALNTILFSLNSGEGFIKIIGEVGAGKTLLCRKLLQSLDTSFVTAYIPNPDLKPIELRRAIARELGLDPVSIADQHELITEINNQLLAIHAGGKKVVLILDEAQALPIESIETIRLLTNLETETTKLLQVVLFGQPELDKKINRPSLRQLKQRIGFSYYLPLMSREDLDSYLFHRIAIAGSNYTTLFTNKARDLLYKSSKGIPRIVNILCHKALLAAYGKGEKVITTKTIKTAVKDTDVLVYSKSLVFPLIFILYVIILSVLVYYLYEGYL